MVKTENGLWKKERIVKKYLNGEFSQQELSKEENVSVGLLNSWIHKYLENGIDGFKSKRKGNIFSALHTSKSLSENDRLKLIIMKQEIEIERLKKGYEVKCTDPKKLDK